MSQDSILNENETVDALLDHVDGSQDSLLNETMDSAAADDLLASEAVHSQGNEPGESGKSGIETGEAANDASTRELMIPERLINETGDFLNKTGDFNEPDENLNLAGELNLNISEEEGLAKALEGPFYSHHGQVQLELEVATTSPCKNGKDNEEADVIEMIAKLAANLAVDEQVL